MGVITPARKGNVLLKMMSCFEVTAVENSDEGYMIRLLDKELTPKEYLGH